jgi:hypothetical protein
MKCRMKEAEQRRSFQMEGYRRKLRQIKRWRKMSVRKRKDVQYEGMEEDEKLV